VFGAESANRFRDQSPTASNVFHLECEANPTHPSPSSARFEGPLIWPWGLMPASRTRRGHRGSYVRPSIRDATFVARYRKVVVFNRAPGLGLTRGRAGRPRRRIMGAFQTLAWRVPPVCASALSQAPPKSSVSALAGRPSRALKEPHHTRVSGTACHGGGGAPLHEVGVSRPSVRPCLDDARVGSMANSSPQIARDRRPSCSGMATPRRVPRNCPWRPPDPP